MKEFNTELKIQFKKRTNYTWEVWTDNEHGGNYIRDITVDNIYALCNEVESKNDIVNMSPIDFIRMVFDLFFCKILDGFDNIDFYSSNFEAFSNWFDREVLDWYCIMIKGLI